MSISSSVFNQSIRFVFSFFSYKKQSSGKDLSSRTNDELDCIFGWNKAIEINANELKEAAEKDKVKFN